LEFGSSRFLGATGMVAGLLLGACANSPLTLPELPPIPTVGSLPDLSSLGSEEPKLVGSPTELYTRIARGAMACWFGTAGPLKGTHIYHAEAESPAQGGRSEIVIFERNLADPASPRGVRALRISIAEAGAVTPLTVEPAKLPEPMAKRLTADVYRWASGEVQCAKGDATEWSAQAVGEPEKPPEPAVKKVGNKTAR